MVKNNSALLIIPLALTSLLLGVIAGWQRINLDIPITNLAGDHGAVMTGSFIGTLICLERSISEQNKWWRLLPLINAASLLFFILRLPQFAYVFLVAGSIGLLILLITYLRTSPSLSNVFLLGGAFAWLTGNLVLLNQHSYPAAVKWWMLFLLWTIYGERLELSNMLPISVIKKTTLYIIIAINLVGVILPFHWYGNEIFAISLLAMSAWLFSFDMSRHAMKHAGQHRYIALWLMSGYAWLVVAASWLLFWPNAVYSYDAALHSFFLGFVFSMIFGHVPIIFPGIFRVNISLYHPLLYIVFFLFQFSLATRILGDAITNHELRKCGALVNGISILLFIVMNATILTSRLNRKNRNYVALGK